MLQISATWPSPKKLPVDKEVLLMWTSWPCRMTMSIGKWPRGASKAQRHPRNIYNPSTYVTSVMVAVVCPSAATIWGKIGGKKVEIMLDSGSSISLIQESIATPFSD